MPIRVGMIGAGVMAQGIVLHAATSCPGIRIAAIANRTLHKAWQAYGEAGLKDVLACRTAGDLASAIRSGQPAITPDPLQLAEAEGIDVLLEVTGAVEDALPAILAGLAHRKHIVLMNPALDATLGPILRVKADRAGVVYTSVDGTRAGVAVNLVRFVKGIGMKPALCGATTESHDPYRTPLTEATSARRWGQRPSAATAAVDGTRLSLDQAVVANATGMRVARRGMYGPSVRAGTPVGEVAEHYPHDHLLNGPGIVDYVVGAAPSRGVFVLGTVENVRQRRYLDLYGLGPGPLHCFVQPYHLCHFEVPRTVGRAALHREAALAPVGPPVVEVVAAAKRNLRAGETLDDLGHFMTYGVAENADAVASANLLPIGIAPGCRLKRDLKRDEILTYDAVELPSGRLCDRLRQEQVEYFGLTSERSMAL
jgi:predicted homoserine dehydrogenase-like protein